MPARGYAALNRAPEPRAVVECGSYSNPNRGCTDERQDAIAAYADALAWYITRDERYARKVIELMDAWSASSGTTPTATRRCRPAGPTPPGPGPPRSSSTRTPEAGRTPAASRPCSGTSICPR
jgi:hypothetical protein